MLTGDVYMRSKQYDKALAAYLKAIEKEPNSRFQTIFEMSELLRQNAEQMAD